MENRIYLVRGETVMLSTDLARLYQVAPQVFVQAVKLNADRFPEEFQILKSQIVTSRQGVRHFLNNRSVATRLIT